MEQRLDLAHLSHTPTGVKDANSSFQEILQIFRDAPPHRTRLIHSARVRYLSDFTLRLCLPCHPALMSAELNTK